MAVRDRLGKTIASEISLIDRILERWQKIYSNYTVRTLIQALVTVWAVTTFTFFLIRLMPGNPVEVLIESFMNSLSITYEEAYARAASQFRFDFNAPLTQQYLDYFGQLLRLDLGESITSVGTPVIDQILRFLPWTLFSAGLGLLFSFVIGFVLGMLMAYYRNSPLDHSLSFLSSIMSAVPNYIFGLLILVVFGVQLQWFSIGNLRGTYDPNQTPGFTLEFILDVLEHAFLPVLTYVLGTIGSWMLSTKSSTVSVLGEDYVNIAEARGLPERRILTAYVGRNAALPLFTLLAISVGFIIGGSVLIEELFVYKGLGSFLFLSISKRDYTSMQGVFLFITFSVVLSNLLADLLYGRLDPRIRISGEK
jgi:peptide/nickel transport system permease protein